MSDMPQKNLKAAITEAIGKKQGRESLTRCMERGRIQRSARLGTMPTGAAFRAEVKAIKERCIEQQDELLEQFIEKARERGAKVYLAKDRADVAEYVLQLARERGYKHIAKSKSLTTEEIFLNEDIEEAGLQVVETDLGELILQLAHEKPFHLVFPAVHKMTAEVAEIFAKATGKEIAPDIPSIMNVVRPYLKPIFLNADIGMTGANVGIAETGGIVIETNEGNARLVSSIGECHVCVMGVEKIVRSVDEALLMCLAHPVSASGQMPTTYVTWMHGRSPLGEDGPERDTHYIILDNGRSRMRQDPVMREALHCIRCGACMNICPTYGVAGGHTFGYVYPGPIGIPWTAEVHGLEKAGHFASLCISCGLCKEICPAEIDMPMMIAEVKQRDSEHNHPQPLVNKMLMAAETASKIGCATAPLSNWTLRNKAFRWALDRFGGIDRRRELPPFAKKTLVQRFNARTAPPKREGARKVAYFHDLYANYNVPDLGMAAIEHLEQQGCEVALPEQQASGYPCIGYGDLHQAREIAAYNVRRLVDYVRDGYTVVATEPTAAYVLQVSYKKLLPHNDFAKEVAAASHEYFEFLLKLEGFAPGNGLEGRRFGYHCSCHQRPLGCGSGAMEWLRRHGAEVQFVETGTCCGMGGTFGMKSGALGYDLANAVGEPLFERFKASETEAIVTESSVCRIHLHQGTGMQVYHPLELLAQA